MKGIKARNSTWKQKNEIDNRERNGENDISVKMIFPMKIRL